MSLVGEAHDVTAYAARGKDALLVAAVNKSGTPVQMRVRGGGTRAMECWTLTAPSLDAMHGVQFVQAGMDERALPHIQRRSGNCH